MTTPESPAPAPAGQDDAMGCFTLFGLLLGGGCILFGGAGALNTFFDLSFALRVYGSRVDLPNSYEASVALVITGALFIALTFFGGFVARKFSEAKGKPLVRTLIIVGAILLLVVVGRGLQIAALVNTYGSMLAYYSTDGDLEDVKAELAKNPEREHLDRAVGRAAQYDNVEALKLLMDHGADMRGKGLPKDHRRCHLRGTSPEFIEVAVDRGVTPKTCPNSRELIWYAVFDGRGEDKKTTKIVKLLARGGWSPSAHDKDSESPLELAQQRDLPKTAKALEKLIAEEKKKPRKKKKKSKKKKKTSE